MLDTYQAVLQAALQLPLDQQAKLREALEDAESTGGPHPLPPRIPGLNASDPPLLHHPDAPVPPEFLGDDLPD